MNKALRILRDLKKGWLDYPYQIINGGNTIIDKKVLQEAINELVQLKKSLKVPKFKKEEKFQAKIWKFKSRAEAIKFLFEQTEDATYNFSRIRNYEIVDMALSDGFVINIEEVCPINGFASGFKNIKDIHKIIEENTCQNGITILNEDLQWIIEKFPKMNSLGFKKLKNNNGR